jgi:hypothetical protein
MAETQLSLHNWNRTVAVQPARLVRAIAIDDVQACVRDPSNPSPVSAAGV